MIGGVDSNNKAEDNFTTDQYDALEDLLNVLHRMYRDAEILGHRDLSPDINGDGIIDKWEWKKECPCFDVSDFIKDRGIVWTKKKTFWDW
jgi:N-acetylmuramoyl-L-alanine amidase